MEPENGFSYCFDQEISAICNFIQAQQNKPRTVSVGETNIWEVVGVRDSCRLLKQQRKYFPTISVIQNSTEINLTKEINMMNSVHVHVHHVGHDVRVHFLYFKNFFILSAGSYIYIYFTLSCKNNSVLPQFDSPISLTSKAVQFRTD